MAPKPAETTNYFTCEAMMFIAAALFFNTLTAPVVKLTQNEQGGYDYNKFCVYFFAEFFKLAAAVVWCYRAWAANDPAVVKHLVFEKTDFMQYAVPGFVFFAQNNLSFLALQHMNSSAFQLLMNTRIVSVAVLAVLVLNKKLHALEWTSITLLMVGAMQYQLSGCGGDGYKIDGQGLVVMAVIVACAAGGNVYTQKVMQKKDGPAVDGPERHALRLGRHLQPGELDALRRAVRRAARRADAVIRRGRRYPNLLHGLLRHLRAVDLRDPQALRRDHAHVHQHGGHLLHGADRRRVLRRVHLRPGTHDLRGHHARRVPAHGAVEELHPAAAAARRRLACGRREGVSDLSHGRAC
mmetsp:Transcript_28518/g.86014  ORF Transcript_28518/g.86014 Transcript_28518/m.86014 type:complete len:352 (-) Transcript_28518:29-1084(-)